MLFFINQILKFSKEINLQHYYEEGDPKKEKAFGLAISSQQLSDFPCTNTAEYILKSDITLS